MEVVLALVTGTIILGVAGQSMLSNLDSYTFLAGRKSSLADARSAMTMMRDELLKLDQVATGGNIITGLGSTSISFVDSNGATASYRLSAYGSGMGLYRGNKILIESVEDFSLEYFDASGEIIDPNDGSAIADTKRIKVSITTAPESNEGSVTLSTTITPRDFIGYTNYQ